MKFHNCDSPKPARCSPTCNFKPRPPVKKRRRIKAGTGLEPVISWSTVWRSTNWATRSLHIYFGHKQHLMDTFSKHSMLISFKSPGRRYRVNYGNCWRHKSDHMVTCSWINYVVRRVCHKIQLERKHEKIRKMYDNFRTF